MHDATGTAAHLGARLLGVATVGYAIWAVRNPRGLNRAAGLPNTSRTLAVARASAVRDLICGTAMVAAPNGAPLRRAVIARTACDLVDFVGFGIACPKSHKAKTMGIAGGWAALNAATLPGLRR